MLALGFAAGLAALVVVRFLVRRVLRRRRPELADALRARCADVLGWLLPLVGLYLALPASGLDARQPWLRPLLVSLLIVTVGLMLVRLVAVLQDTLTARIRLDVADNLRARRFHTQFRILRQFVTVVIWVVTLSAVLLQIEAFRQFGAGLLASAGIASIVLGFAAQRTLGNLIAGFQIALAQPIRLDDVVVIENEWGRIEEITLTYVIVHIWDERRLVLPISWFLENPFTNWTRRTSELLGTVYLYVDFTAPVAALRDRLAELVENHPDWDRRVAEIVVTDSTASNMQLRVLVSTRDSGGGWRLRCHVREGLLTFLAENHPFALPRAREQHVHPPGSQPHP